MGGHLFLSEIDYVWRFGHVNELRVKPQLLCREKTNPARAENRVAVPEMMKGRARWWARGVERIPRVRGCVGRLCVTGKDIRVEGSEYYYILAQ
jgi:hypothetical protein